MNVICRECKYFNKKNLCSANGKQSDGITVWVMKTYIETVVVNTGKCKYFKSKNWVSLIIQNFIYWIKNRSK